MQQVAQTAQPPASGNRLAPTAAFRPRRRETQVPTLHPRQALRPWPANRLSHDSRSLYTIGLLFKRAPCKKIRPGNCCPPPVLPFDISRLSGIFWPDNYGSTCLRPPLGQTRKEGFSLKPRALPEQLRQLAGAERFHFHCHPGVSCFTECCRELELALSPYDVLRLKKHLGLTSQEFLDQYALVEYAPTDPYPQVYLGMVDDGRASCPFVGGQGCRVYPDRPGACRVYPLGRAAQPDGRGGIEELFVLLQEPHCQGFAAERAQTAAEWCGDQGLSDYNQFSDRWLRALTELALGDRNLTPAQADAFILALYNLDAFRALLAAQPPNPAAIDAGISLAAQPLTDEETLTFGLRWLGHELSRP